MNPFLVLLVLVVSPLRLILAGPIDWRQEPESESSVVAVLKRRNPVFSTKQISDGLVAHQRRPETNFAFNKTPSARHGLKPTSQVGPNPKGPTKPGSASEKIVIAHNITTANSAKTIHSDSTNTEHHPSGLTLNTHLTPKMGITHTYSSNIASTAFWSSSEALVGSSNPTITSFDTPNDSSGGAAQKKPSSTGTEVPNPYSTDFTDAVQPSSNPTGEEGDIYNLSATASGAQPTSSSALEDGDAPPYNLKNVACSDYWSLTGPEKWNATDGDKTLQSFVDMFASDKLFCEDCFGQLKSQCDSKNVTCKNGIRTRATPDPKFGPSWSVAAAWFAQYGKADHFTCQMGTENECPHAPECKNCGGGRGAGATALLEALSNTFVSFKENYDAMSKAGDLCEHQMQHFSDVFAPVPDNEGEAIGIMALTALLGGIAGFLTGGAGAFAGIATGLGSGIGMEKYFHDQPGPKDTSSSLGIIVNNVLYAYGNMSNQLFHDGKFQHSSSDGKSNVDLSLEGLMVNGGAMAINADPHDHFTGLIPKYQRLFFQQLALVTWQNLEVDGKTHIPFIAFNKGPCDKVDPKQKTSAASHGYLEGIDKLDSHIDYQGDCYYLLDAYPEVDQTKAEGPQCKGNHHLPGGTYKDLTVDNVDQFQNLSLEDFIVPSVLGWQNHSKTNGYESAVSNGNLIDDPQAPGVVNIPICDYVTDLKHPGVGCPLVDQDAANTKKCKIVPASEGHNQPGQYQQGGCRAHVVQWQKNEVKNNANQLPDYQLSVNMYDQDNRPMGSATKQDAAKPLEVDDTVLPYDLIVVPGVTDDDPVYFWYADQYWMSNETDHPHKCQGGGGKGGGGGYDNGFRQIDCGFDCPLKQPDDDPPTSATIAHPLPGPPAMAVAGATSYVNTYSKTMPAVAAATPDYTSGVCVPEARKDSNPTNDYQLEINVKDSDGKEAANLPKVPCPSGKPVAMHGLKGGDFTVTVGKDLDEPLKDDSPLSFNYNGQDFDTKSLKCNIGGYQDGDREMNCNINC
ncbi:MAG: hypothetical protein Q9225_005509 [Loekoesia sp. 1 TL-2023]